MSAAGIQEAIEAGKILKQNGYKFDVAYTSVLTRAIQTFNYAAEELDCLYIPLLKSWRLNERHYGALQGLNKSETTAKHGEEQVKIWRRSFDIPPPPLEINDSRHPSHDSRYSGIDPALLPATEVSKLVIQSLKETVARVLPLWEGEISDIIRSGKNLLIVAHGNSIRSIVKYLDKISEKGNWWLIADITELDIPTAVPLIYEFDAELKPVKHYYLADPEELEKKVQSVKNQAKVKPNP